MFGVARYGASVIFCFFLLLTGSPYRALQIMCVGEQKVVSLKDDEPSLTADVCDCWLLDCSEKGEKDILFA